MNAPNASPVVHLPRSVPFTFQDQLKYKLDRMVKDKVTTKVSRLTVRIGCKQLTANL